jgi:hypothetical protein
MAADGFVDTVFTEGIKHANFFNGRLFTAEDMTQEARAEHQHLELVGQAVGAGVVSGLWVTSARSTVTVTAGLALNREGTALRLGVTTSFDISPAAARPTPPDVVFTDCHQVGAPVSATAAGPYLLVIAPAWRFEGAVPMKSFGGSATATAGCGRKWRVEGVGFRLLRLTPPPAVSSDPRRRNRLAHWLLGTDRLRDSDGVDAPEEPFLDTLPGVEPSDVPLALLYWSGTAIEFVDCWAARRRVAHPPATLPWTGGGAAAVASPPLPLSPFGSYVSDWRLAEAQARFLQFQHHIDDLASAVPPITGSARQHFRFLPPVGFVPITGASTGHQTLAGRSPRGLHLGNFLGITFGDLEGTRREIATLLLQRSLPYEPINADGGGLFDPRHIVTFLQVVENLFRVATDHSSQYYVVFVKQSFHEASLERMRVHSFK